MEFTQALKNTTGNISYTENGMQGYKSIGNTYTEFLYKISSFRGKDNIDIGNACDEFIKQVMNTPDKQYLLKFIFYIRDPRNGLGERKLFRIFILHLFCYFDFNDKQEIFKWVVHNLYNYARWDDLVYIISYIYEAMHNEQDYYNLVPLIRYIEDYLKKTLENDLSLFEKNAPITLLAKWMPSINTSSKETRDLACILMVDFEWSEKQYRQTLSKLRKYLKVTERQMSSNEWSEIDYEKVPSLANLRYKDAFMRHDEERRKEYLSKLSKGEAKINSSVNFPHDVVHKYSDYNYHAEDVGEYNETLEQLWKNLKQIDGLKDTLVVRDDSGSMISYIGKTGVTALEVATALGIYCAEHCSETYKNKIISFSKYPQYLDFNNKISLHDKLDYLYEHSEVANTNIRKVFQLILKTAIDNNLKQENLPKQILIISDMEFDEGTDYVGNPIEESQVEYKKYGYTLPRLVFWNINGRTNTIPVTQNDMGVYLLSGFSPNVLNILSYGVDNQFEALKEELDRKFKEVPEIK